MEPNQPHQASVDAGTQECLIIILGGQEYGIDILRVQEIRGYDSQNITAIADMPEFILGITNLRGVIVPIVDLRKKFKLDNTGYTDQTVVVVLNIHDRVVGAVVDGVSDVVNLQPEQIRAAPQFNATLSTQFLTGIGTVGERMMILVDIERLMSSRDMALIEQSIT